MVCTAIILIDFVGCFFYYLIMLYIEILPYRAIGIYSDNLP